MQPKKSLFFCTFKRYTYYINQIVKIPIMSISILGCNTTKFEKVKWGEHLQKTLHSRMNKINVFVTVTSIHPVMYSSPFVQDSVPVHVCHFHFPAFFLSLTLISYLQEVSLNQ